MAELEVQLDATIKQVTAGFEGEVRRLSGDMLGRQEATDALLKHHSDRLGRLEEMVATSVQNDVRTYVRGSRRQKRSRRFEIGRSWSGERRAV